MATGFAYVSGLLTFLLEPTPAGDWVRALVTLGDYQKYTGLAEPARVQVTPTGAHVPANENTAVEVARLVKQWVSSANREYRKQLREKAIQEEQRQRAALAAHRRRLEEEARVMERLRKASLA